MLIADPSLSDIRLPDSTLSIKSSNALDDPVKYKSSDSIRFDIKNKMIYMYGSSEVKYQDITLNAAYIDVNWTTHIISAEGLPDSIGNLIGKPEFKDGGQSFKAKRLLYNFDTKKGKLYHVITKEGEGYIHGSEVKKLENDDFYIKDGKYTTCENENPHFEIHADKLKVMKENKIVATYPYLAFAGVPAGALPFGMFPNKQGQTSGIMLPTYGVSEQLGFYLTEGGYYLAISDYLDYTLTGDIYTKGSWQMNNQLRYVKRYKFNGSLAVKLSNLKYGEKTDPDYSADQAFIVTWKHAQDAKARPNSKFSANVKFGTSNFYSNNLENTQNYLDNNYTSSISWSKNMGLFNLTTNASHNQNTKTHAFTLTLPELTLNTTRDLYPLKWRKTTTDLRWHEKIRFRYSLNAKNTISTQDTLLFLPESMTLNPSTMQKFRYGVKQTPSIIFEPIKLFKFFNINNSINYTGRFYFQQLNREFKSDSLVTDTLNGLYYVHDYGVSSSLSTTVYGIKMLKNDLLKGVMHKITPSLSFNYNPAFGTENKNVDYYDTYIDTLGEENTYSRYENFLYGNAKQNQSGSIGLYFNNRLEVKIRTKRDSIGNSTYTNIPIFESFKFGTSYDLAKDSLNFSPLSLSTSTSMLNSLINLRYQAKWDPYVYDTTIGGNINKFEWTENKRVARFQNGVSNLGVTLKLSPDMGKKLRKQSNKATEDENKMISDNYYSDYVDFTIPWKLNLSYNMVHSLTQNGDGSWDTTLTNTFNFNGEVLLTEAWKVTFSSGYDIEDREFTPTKITFYRDLHCWEMRFMWVPFGTYQSYEFSINVKSAVLQDLKLNRQRKWYDN